jgi:hypothetical protein
VELCEREQFEALDRWVKLAYARALALAGQYQPALAVIERVMEVSERLGMGGLSTGAVYELRARIAIWMGERAVFEQFAQRCADEYKKGKNPALTAKFARLMEEARQADGDAQSRARESNELFVLSQTETGYETIQSRMLECVDQDDRARCALTILLQSSDSFAGHLFGVRDQLLIPLAALPEAAPDTGLARWLESCLRTELESQASATVTAEGEDDDGRSDPPNRYTDGEGRLFEPVFLVARHEHEDRIAAVLAMQVNPGPRTVPPKELLAEIAEQLVAHGDVKGIPVPV